MVSVISVISESVISVMSVIKVIIITLIINVSDPNCSRDPTEVRNLLWDRSSEVVRLFKKISGVLSGTVKHSLALTTGGLGRFVNIVIIRKEAVVTTQERYVIMTFIKSSWS